MEGDKLSKNDLFILMESYKNNIQLNTTLLEQQKQLIVMINQSVDKQKDLCDNLDNFIEKLTNCSTRLEENHSKVVSMIENKTSAITTQMTSNCSAITNQMTNCNSENAKDHSKIITKIHLGWIGMAGIIVALIGLAATYTKQILDLAHLIKG